MQLVKHILEKKGNQVYSISPDQTVFEALNFMSEKGIGALLVMESDKVLGIMSERDYARKVILHGKSSKELKVGEIMSENVLCVDINNSIDECMAVMNSKRVRHLPVVENGKLTGILSIGDIVNAVIEDKEFTINQLTNYITGNR
ncbi:MAG: CBS domain-containing protein [Bacteroidetes bacterium]|nr:CBS domain-containing protein [Bacteroidota bacterium]